MDNDIGGDAADFFSKCRVIRYIPVGQIGDGEFVRGEVTLERAPQHPLAARNENLHASP